MLFPFVNSVTVENPHLLYRQNREWRKKRCSDTSTVTGKAAVLFCFVFVPAAPEQFQHETRKF